MMPSDDNKPLTREDFERLREAMRNWRPRADIIPDDIRRIIKDDDSIAGVRGRVSGSV